MGLFQFFQWGILLQVLAVLHFIRRRPETFWLWIIVFFGPIGASIYILMEVVPDLGLLRQSFEGFGRRKRIRYLEALVQQNPAAGNYEELGDLYLDQGQYAKARECFDKAITPRTSHADPFYRRAVAAMQMGDFAAATGDLELVTERDPKYDSNRALGLLAHACANTGRPADAETYFQRALELSTLSETYLNYATFLASQNRPDDARQWAERILANKATMPRYLQRRERPWFRKASALLKRLPKIAIAFVLFGVSLAAQSESRFRLTAEPNGEIPYFIADAEPGSGSKPGDAQLAEWAMQEWERSLRGPVRFRRAQSPSAARLRVRWLPWAEDAALGRMDPISEGDRVIAVLDIRPDETRFRPSVTRRVRVDPLMRDVVLYYVCLHEIGHALGLSHSDNPRDVMWPGANGVTLPIYDRYRHHLTTRDDIPRVDWLSDHDVARVKAIW